MRLPPIAPADLDATQKPLYDDMRGAIAQALQGFVSERGDGALIGPFNPMLHFPAWGGPFWSATRSLIDHTGLPKGAHEVAILAVGARLGSRYEMYAHEHVASNTDLDAATIAAVCAGQRPASLTGEEAAAYDVTASLLAGGSLPESTYQRAIDAFGRDGVAELVYLIAGYAAVSVLLNAYDADVPGSDESGRSGG